MLVRRLTSSPLATTIASPTSPIFPPAEALSTSGRPRRSVTQRQAVPPSLLADQNTLLPSTWSVLSRVFQSEQSTEAASGCTRQSYVSFVQRHRPWRMRTRLVNGTVSTPLATAAPDR